jgi:hypothetical protein
MTDTGTLLDSLAHRSRLNPEDSVSWVLEPGFIMPLMSIYRDFLEFLDASESGADLWQRYERLYFAPHKEFLLSYLSDCMGIGLGELRERDDYPDRLAINLTDSIIRARYRNGWDKPELLELGKVYEFNFQLYPTSNVFRKGHRIRLDISSSNFPRFDVNPNAGGDLGLERRFEIAHQTIYHDSEYPSRVVLPIIKLSKERTYYG